MINSKNKKETSTLVFCRVQLTKSVTYELTPIRNCLIEISFKEKKMNM